MVAIIMFVVWVHLYVCKFCQFSWYSSRIVKEGGLDTLVQVSAIVVYGAIVSNIVCFLLWPQNAISALQSSMVQTFDSFILPPNMDDISRRFEADTPNLELRYIVQLKNDDMAIRSTNFNFVSSSGDPTPSRMRWRNDGNENENRSYFEGYFF